MPRHLSRPPLLATLVAAAAVLAPAATAAAATAPAVPSTSTAAATLSGPPGAASDAAGSATADSTLTGAPAAAGLTATPLRTVRVGTAAALQTAINGARPGDLILLGAGTYRGPFLVKSSGSAGHPVVVRPDSGAAVTLTATLPMPSCSASGPDSNRTLRFMGASHWVLSGLTVSGGILLSGTNADVTQNWQSQMIKTANWKARRAVPSSGSRAPAQLASVTTYLSTLLNKPVSSADDIQILNSTVTSKGIFGRLTRFGVISGTTVNNIACGTGPAIWLSNFSSGWTISNNDVSKVADSAYSHFMHEGIRLGNQSNYAVVSGNTVHDMVGDSRAITTDQDSSWNLFTHNTVARVGLGYNDQMSGWGNVWSYNLATAVTQAGFSFRMQDIGLTTPSPNSSTFYSEVTCNRVTSVPSSVRGFQAGAMKGVSVTSNAFATAYVGRNLASYWAAQGNTFNGTNKPPTSSPTTTSGC